MTMHPASGRRPPPDWRLPPGVNHGLWDYLHSTDLARGYDAGLAGSSLFAGDRVMPTHQGVAGLTLHLYTRREAVRCLRRAGFRVVEVLPVGLGADVRLRRPWWFGRLRAYGYLLAAEKPGGPGERGA